MKRPFSPEAVFGNVLLIFLDGKPSITFGREEMTFSSLRTWHECLRLVFFRFKGVGG